MSDLPDTMNRVRQRIGSDVGVPQVVKLRLEPSPAQVELLRGYCGTARAAYNILLYQVRANVGQRAADKTYDIAADDMTPALPWHRFGLEKLLRENRAQWLPWHEQVPYVVLDRSAHHLAAGLARWKSGAAKFPRFRKKHGPGAGLAPVTFKEKDAAWLTGGGRVLALPLSKAKRREHGGGVGRLGAVVKDNRGRRAAKLIRDGAGRSKTSRTRSAVATGGRPCGCGCCPWP